MLLAVCGAEFVFDDDDDDDDNADADANGDDDDDSDDNAVLVTYSRPVEWHQLKQAGYMMT